MSEQTLRRLSAEHMHAALTLLLVLMLTISTAWAGSPMNPAYAEPDKPGLPASNMELDPQRVALVVIDPQNDFLTEKGVAWGVVGKSVMEHNVVEHLEDLFKAAKSSDMPVFISPHSSISA